MVHLKSIPKLSSLSISNLQLSSDGLAAVSELKLEQLHFNGSKLDDLEFVSKIKSLRHLRLIADEISSSSLAKLGVLQSLTSLDLSSNRFKSKGMIHLRSLTKLTQLHLKHNNLDDGAVSEITRLKELTDLDLSATEITDAGLIELHKLSKLKKLTVKGCPGITQAGVAQFKEKLPGCVVIYH